MIIKVYIFNMLGDFYIRGACILAHWTLNWSLSTLWVFIFNMFIDFSFRGACLFTHWAIHCSLSMTGTHMILELGPTVKHFTTHITTVRNFPTVHIFVFFLFYECQGCFCLRFQTDIGYIWSMVLFRLLFPQHCPHDKPEVFLSGLSVLTSVKTVNQWVVNNVQSWLLDWQDSCQGLAWQGLDLLASYPVDAWSQCASLTWYYPSRKTGRYDTWNCVFLFQIFPVILVHHLAPGDSCSNLPRMWGQEAVQQERRQEGSFLSEQWSCLP